MEERKIYYLVALLIGVFISVMIAVNGELSAVTGVYTSSVIIHIIGLIVMTGVLIIKKSNPFRDFKPWYLYLGGVFGVLATAGNNYAFSYLGVSSILALGLLGQTIMGLLIDNFGLFGMKSYKIKPIRLIGITIMLLGSVFMIRNADNIIAMTLSFLVGAALVLQRVVNSNLSQKTNVAISTAYTYIVGLIGSVICLLVLGQGEMIFTEFIFPSSPILYIGGIIGTLTVFLSIICVGKVPAYSLSVIIFIGQVFSGLILDKFLFGEIANVTLIGGVIITFGLCIDMYISKFKEG